MTSVLFEIALIFVLLIANGVFAMTEIAIVSSRRGKLQAMADAGDKGAAKALELAETPERFLSTVQIGITLIGILASIFGGARTVVTSLDDTKPSSLAWGCRVAAMSFQPTRPGFRFGTESPPTATTNPFSKKKWRVATLCSRQSAAPEIDGCQ